MTSNKNHNGWKDKLSLSGFGTSLFTALFVFLLEIIFVIAFTALIYSGELASQVPLAIGFIIVGDAVLCAIVACFGSNPALLAIEQDAPGAMLSVVAVGIITALSGSTSRQFATVTMMIVMTTSITGLFMFAIGYFKLGELVRYLPYPVIGGFLAGTGWLLVQGGIGLMSNASMGLEWFRGTALLLWIPGAVLAIVIHLVTRKMDKPYTIPLLMLCAGSLFYLVVFARGIPLQQLRLGGWLFDSASTGSVWRFPLRADLLSQVEWNLLLKNSPALIPVSVISMIALLLNVSGMELIIKKDIDLNRELLVAGIGNLAAGLTGGLVGYQDVSFSTLNHSMAGGKRLVGILTAIFLVATLFIGASAILYIPKFIFGSVLIFLGVQLLSEWVYEAWFKFSRVDFAVIVSILLTIMITGFLQGIVVGLIMAIVMFVVNYSRINVVRHALSGAEISSSVERCSYHERVLQDKLGHHIFILELEGFIFFGTANALLEQVRTRLADAASPTVRYIVFDFRRVSGFDSSAIINFVKCRQIAGDLKITLVLTNLAVEMQKSFKLHDLTDGQEGIRVFPDLDHALEWCEEQLLEIERITTMHLPVTLGAQLADNGFAKADTARLMKFLEKIDFKNGETLIRQGEEADSLYFIEQGMVSVYLEVENEKRVRLQTLNLGTAIGEPGLYLGMKNSTSVIAETDGRAYRLTRLALAEMKKQESELASTFHELIVRLLSERLLATTRTLKAVLR